MEQSVTQAEVDAAARRYVEGRERVVAISDDTGINRRRIYVAAQKLGLKNPVPGNVVRSLDEFVGEMKPIDAVDFLLDLCHRLLVDEGGPSYVGFRGMGFSPAEARVLSELDAKRGWVIPMSVLEAVSNPQRDFDVDSSKVLKVYVSKIRAKLSAMECPVEITTAWRDGYMMTVPQEYLWPWEANL